MNKVFVSKQAEIEFYLTQLRGATQKEKLGITDEHYTDKLLAQEWHNALTEFVKSPGAVLELDTIYNLMTCDDWDFQEPCSQNNND